MQVIETSWRYRRLVVFATLVWAGWMLAWIALYGADTMLVRVVAETVGWIIMTVIGLYIGGATWDDLNRMRHGRLDAAAPPSALDERG